ncbi:fungal-specific transcription factor domain-containing protein [Tricladium varicosporioides]|nr:fungal-specific transcription factor domain-containing protein [Hymenoscyphus varicosporioides]
MSSSEVRNNPHRQNDLTMDEPQDEEWAEDEDDKGSTCSLDVANIDADRDETRPTGHMGKSSSVIWAQRTAEECRQSNQEPSFGLQSLDYIPPSYHTEDLDMETIDLDKILVFELPEPLLAQDLLDAYFTQVHPVFPVLDWENFLSWYRSFKTSRESLRLDNSNRLAILNIIFAIMTYYANLTDAPYKGHHNDHLVYAARAKKLYMDERILYEDSKISTISALGLLCLYFMATCRLNRAWTICGVAIRNSLTLGLHLRNNFKEIPVAEKEYRARLWWALYSLECSLDELTGRPTCISDRDITTSIPGDTGDTLSRKAQPFPKITNNNIGVGDSSIQPSAGDVLPSQILAGVSKEPDSFRAPEFSDISSSYFFHRVELCRVSHETVSNLYSASTTKRKWSQIQDTIQRIDQQLSAWKRSLPPEFGADIDTYVKVAENDEILRYRTSLAMLFNSSRMILFRPCLCRFKGRINQGDSLRREFGQQGAEACVKSATRMIALISWADGNVKRLYAISPWWSILHYLCEALSVLTLELAFLARHMPTEKAYILEDAKKGIRCLSVMSSKSISARKAWEIFDNLFRRVAPLNYWSVYDMPVEAPIPPGYKWDRAVKSLAVAQSQARPEYLPEDHQLSRSNLQEYQQTHLPVSPSRATSTWTNQPQSFQPFVDQTYPSSSSEELGNHLSSLEALNRFSTMGNIHGHYDDDWSNLFSQNDSDRGSGMFQGNSFDAAIQHSYGGGMGYRYFDDMSGNTNPVFMENDQQREFEEPHFSTGEEQPQQSLYEGMNPQTGHQETGREGGFRY